MAGSYVLTTAAPEDLVEYREAPAVRPGPLADYWYVPRPGIATPAAAMAVSSVHACVRKIAELTAILPIILYRRLEQGKERAPDSSLYRLLHDKPNPIQSAYEWRELMGAHCALRGNAYSRIVSDPAGEILALLPIHPDRVRVGQLEGGGIGYEVRSPGGGAPEVLTGSQMFHLRDLGTDGLEGLSRIEVSRNAAELAIRQEQYGANLWKNGGRPSGILKSPRALKDGQGQKLINQFAQTYSVNSPFGKIALLEEDTSFQQISLSNEDAQYLESRRFSVEEIARIFGVPLWLLTGEGGGSSEERAEELVKFCLGPWIKRWEGALNSQLIDDEDLFAELLVEEFLRASIGTRYTAHATSLQNGWTNLNEVRSVENLPGIGEAGDVYMRPANMVDAESLLDPPDQPAAPPAVPVVDPTDPNPTPAKASGKTIAANPADNSHLRALEAWAGDVAQRLAASELRELRKKLGNRSTLDSEWLRDFYKTAHRPYIEKACAPLFGAAIAGGDPANLIASVADSIQFRSLGELFVCESIAAVLERWETSKAAAIKQTLLEAFTDGDE